MSSDNNECRHDETRLAELQIEMSKQVIQDDSELLLNALGSSNPSLLIGGLDITYTTSGVEAEAIAGLVVIDYDTLSIVYETYSYHKKCNDKFSFEYKPGYLGFREGKIMSNLIDTMRAEFNGIVPDVLMVDGNGVWHIRQCGLACHVGLQCDNIPTIGVSKKFYYINDESYLLIPNSSLRLKCPNNQSDVRKTIEHTYLQKIGDTIYYVDSDSNTKYGAFLRTSAEAINPVYVSVGHKISLETSIQIVMKCCKQFRIPEPIRLADIKTREKLRKENH